LNIEKEKIEKWVEVGAQPTKTVLNLMKTV
jgi:ribosomal protein S16